MKRIKDWLVQWLQGITLVILLFIPTFFDFAAIIRPILENEKMELDTAKYFWLVELGNWAIGLVLMLLILFKFLRTNNEKSTLNKGNLDHDHCYIGYLFCAKVLGYQKCNLIGIPVPMQFKLIMNDIFKEYDFGEETDYKKVDDERIKIKKA